MTNGRHFIAHHEDVHGPDFLSFVRASVSKLLPGAQIPQVDQIAGSLAAYINHGRWVADCPAGDGWSLLVSRATPLFFCGLCLNKGNDGKWLQVEFPAEKERIEHELLKRQAAHPILSAPTRNWRPTEKVADLIRENAARGVV